MIERYSTLTYILNELRYPKGPENINYNKVNFGKRLTVATQHLTPAVVKINEL